ncbi:protein translocase subunit SecD [Ornithinimicrobium sufpigmenti]|uniref:protein translocase subunit SecD n=1 Tax=Ornithinimicrobium sufpigmenti TaxID=2508882 RepID=UPI001036B30D|nr:MULTISPECIES: protein translocase subunit SecD [unclassified Ornithinimicrobium]
MSFTTPNTSRPEEDLPGSGRTTGRKQTTSSGRPPKTKSRGRRRARMRGPIRTLVALAVVMAALFGGIGAAHVWGNPRADLTPQLGLDLAGGRQIVIAPITEEGASVSSEQLDQAIDIIRRRVDGTGVSEAEVSQMGSNISVAIPGSPTREQLEALGRSSQLQFRPVLAAQLILPPGEELPAPRTLPLPRSVLEELNAPDPEGVPDPLTEGIDGQDEDADVDDAVQTEENRGGEAPAALRGGTSAAVSAQAAAGTTDVLAAQDAEQTEAPDSPEQTQTPEEPLPPADPSDLNQITAELQQQFLAEDCTGDVASDVANAPADEPIVTCNTEATEKYILGPTELSGASVTDATFGPEQLQGGAPTGRWQVVLTFDNEGGQTFADITQRLFSYRSAPSPTGQVDARNRFAMVLDGEVISAPGVQSVISGGTATITGDFTAEESETLANQLRFGALPLSFEVQTDEQISPTLGGEQLRWGMIAGGIGLLLVFAFMLVQYHALGFVAIAALVIAAALAYGGVTLLGWSSNLRLTMAGITGLIVSIGITADSFIVYFERIRDEVRAGRPLRYAVDTGWARARRTLIISDVVNLLAAVVLYMLSEAGVAAFAFMLGLATVIDLIVVFMFTHPIVSILANTRYFGEGRKWSGMEPERLGAKRSAYLGRGQVREPDVIPVGSRRHTREELEGGVV